MAKLDSVAMVNAIRSEASAEYQERIPVATRENLITVGQAITEYAPTLNEFTNALVSKIGLQLFVSKMAKNRLAKFKKGTLTNASDIEEIFVAMAQGVTFDKDGANVLARKKPNVSSLYYKENYQQTYEVSVSDAQVKQAFTSPQAMSNLTTQIINSMYSAANHDEYLNMKNLLNTYDENFKKVVVSPVTDEVSGKKFMKAIRKSVTDLTFMSDQYNAQQVKTYTDESDQVLLVHKDVVAEVDVEVLAKAFNLGKTDFQTQVVVVDDFGGMENTLALLVDKDWFMMYDTLRTVESIRNPKGLFTNYFLHIWQIQAVSKFKNAIVFKTA